MVQAGHLGTVAQVVALDQPLGVLDVVEELDGEAERVDDADGVADTGCALPLRDAPYRAAELAEEPLRPPDVSVVLVAAGIAIRRKVEESPAYQELKESGKRSQAPIATLFKHHWPLVVAGALLFAANNAVGYMTTGGYVQSYSVNHLDMDPTVILICVMVAAVGWLASTLAGGRLSDRIGRLRVYRIGFVIQLA
ncbi:MFS transporter [Streptomyces sp. NPDC005483]|uniref:MFS transporter n=1 Tax=Streptomyces sp. NPDC005483 TaxID=3154882 RepID=UPI0033AECB15